MFLAGCAFGFAQGWMNVYQVLGYLPEIPEARRLPHKRDYMCSRGSARHRN